MSDAFVTLIVPKLPIAAVRNVCDCVGVHLHGMLLTGLSPTGASPPTHHISSGFVDQAFVSALSSADAVFALAQAGAAQQGLTLNVTKQQIANAMATFDVSIEPPFTAMARLGLQLVDS